MVVARISPIILGLAAWLLVACGGEDAGTNGSNGVHEKVTDVKVATVQPQTFVDYIELTGTVKADVATTLSSEEPGVIASIVKEKGEWVAAGEVVVRLKSEVLRASFEEARAAYKLSEATFKRQANLFKDNVISEQKYLEFKYGLDRDRARFENLRARLDKTTIKSPVAGYVDKRLVEVGEFVQPGTPLVKIVKTDKVKVTAGVPERFVRDVQAGATAEVSFDVLAGQTFEGRVTFVGPSINPASRTFPVEIELDNRQSVLKPEMFANIRLKRSEVQNAVVIPRDALIETENGKFVFVADGHIARRRQVEIGGAYEWRTWITSGLQAGEQLIVVGHRELVDGERIAIHDSVSLNDALPSQR